MPARDEDRSTNVFERLRQWLAGRPFRGPPTGEGLPGDPETSEPIESADRDDE